MKGIEKKFDNELSLYKCVKGEVSDDELSEVKQMMKESEDVRNTVAQLCMIEYWSEALDCMHNADPVASLKKAKRKIRKNRMNRAAVRMQRFAATLFVPLFCLTAYLSLWQPGVREGQPQLVEITSAPGLITAVVLPDSTKLWLNAGSTVRYPTFFAGSTREVTVSGEAYFSVAKQTGRPFVVNVNDAFNVRVTGTEFNVEAYPEANDFLVTLVEGSVQLSPFDEPEKTMLTLSQGEQLVWNVMEGSLKVNRVNTIEATAWKEGKLIFKNTPMTDIVKTLEKRYNARFIVDPLLTNYSFTGTFVNLQLVQILEHFKLSSNIVYEIIEAGLNTDGTVKQTVVHLR